MTTLERILEPEVMDSPEDASDYDAMDHAVVNRAFVDDLLATLEGSKFKVHRSKFSVQGSEFELPEAALDLEPEGRTCDVLDLGTGTALIPIELCRRFAACRVMAADAAVSMLELARYNVEVQGQIGRIELAHVDAKRLNFADEMFDLVMSNSIIHHIPEPICVLREALRVTRHGGLLFFRDLLRPRDASELQRLVDTYAGGANTHQQALFAESLHAALSLDEIRSLVVSLGYPADSVTQTSDRHWTWSATKP